MLEVELIGQHGRTATGSGRNDNEAITVTVFSTTFARERDRCAPIITPPPIGERSIVMSVSVSLCVFVCPRSCFRNYTSDPHQIFVHVNYGRGSDLIWRLCDTLCTSGLMNDLILAYKFTGWAKK